MPVFRSGKGLAPFWCQMEYFEIIPLQAGVSHRFERLTAQEKIFVGRGQCTIICSERIINATAGTVVDLEKTNASCTVHDVIDDTLLIRVCGRWGDELGGYGVFTISNSADPHNAGDPVDYPRRTAFDNHYHDCDEYWIILAGSARVASEEMFYEIGPGDCLATGMGHHHDFIEVFEAIHGVYFETTLEGQRRRGHLWNHTHGPAIPQRERI